MLTFPALKKADKKQKKIHWRILYMNCHIFRKGGLHVYIRASHAGGDVRLKMMEERDSIFWSYCPSWSAFCVKVAIRSLCSRKFSFDFGLPLREAILHNVLKEEWRIRWYSSQLAICWKICIFCTTMNRCIVEQNATRLHTGWQVQHSFFQKAAESLASHFYMVEIMMYCHTCISHLDVWSEKRYFHMLRTSSYYLNIRCLTI